MRAKRRTQQNANAERGANPSGSKPSAPAHHCAACATRTEAIKRGFFARLSAQKHAHPMLTLFPSSCCLLWQNAFRGPTRRSMVISLHLVEWKHTFLRHINTRTQQSVFCPGKHRKLTLESHWLSFSARSINALILPILIIAFILNQYLFSALASPCYSLSSIPEQITWTEPLNELPLKVHLNLSNLIQSPSGRSIPASIRSARQN